MAKYINQAELFYGDNRVLSNLAVGEVTEIITANKTAIYDVYAQGDKMTYVINLRNTSTNSIENVQISDDLGEYRFRDMELVPLTYLEDSARIFINGVRQTDPTITVTSPLTIPLGSVAPNTTVTVIYEAKVNEFAPMKENGRIYNMATITGTDIEPVYAGDTVAAATDASLSVAKAIDPVPVTDNRNVTYTFTIINMGLNGTTDADSVCLTDTFKPLLKNISVKFNGVQWTDNVNYTYDEATGEFATKVNQIEVPKAIYTQNPMTGEYSVIPGVGTLTVTGKI